MEVIEGGRDEIGAWRACLQGQKGDEKEGDDKGGRSFAVESDSESTETQHRDRSRVVIGVSESVCGEGIDVPQGKATRLACGDKGRGLTRARRASAVESDIRQQQQQQRQRGNSTTARVGIAWSVGMGG